VYCSHLTSIIIPSSVTSIGDAAFWFCTNLTNVTIPDGVTSIGNEAFLGCGLTSVTIPDSVMSIGDLAFVDCTNLTNIAVAAGNPAYSSLNDVLFDKAQTTLIQYPAGLTNANYTIPASVTSISGQAFHYCFNLTSLTFLGNAPALQDSYEFNDDGIFSGTVYYYYGTSGWGNTYGSLPTVILGAPAPQIGGGSANVQSGNFHFTVSGVTNQTIVIEASTNLVSWQPIWTNTLSGTNATFTDSQWTNFPSRYYRAR
jgi:hypothetical protein